MAVLCVSGCALGQDYSKTEAFGGFQYANVDAFGIQRVNLFGFDGQFTQYVHKNFGITADVGGAYGSPNVGGFTNHIKMYSYNFGPTLRLSPSNTTPFIHALFGLTHTDVDSGALHGNWFSFALGGGYDVGISRGLAIRTFQFDYMHTGYDYALGNKSQNNIRLATGVVFKF
jgi:hypothetical protein